MSSYQHRFLFLLGAMMFQTLTSGQTSEPATSPTTTPSMDDLKAKNILAKKGLDFITLSWDKPAVYKGKYRCLLYRKTSTIKIQDEVCDQHHVFEGLKQGTKYSWILRMDATTIHSNKAIAQGNACTILDPPQNVVSNNTEWPLSLSWSGCEACRYTCKIYSKNINYTSSKKVGDSRCKFSNLPGGTPFRVYVTAHRDCASVSTNINATSKTLIPEDVKEISARNTGDTAEITWNWPQLFPGPVNFTVMTVDALTSTILAPLCSVQVQSAYQDVKSTHMRCNGTIHQDYWLYEFFVEAGTEAGASISHRSNIIWSPQGGPSRVQVDIKSALTNDSETDYRRINVTFLELSPRERRAQIMSYVTQLTEIHTSINETRSVTSKLADYASNQSNLTSGRMYLLNDDATVYQNVFYVIPGNKYNITVQAQCEVSCPEAKTYAMEYLAPEGPPKPWDPSVDGSIVKAKTVTKTESALSFMVILKFFQSSLNGAIIDKGLLVSSHARVSEIDFQALQSYQDISQSSVPEMYRVNVPGLDQASEQSALVIIGQDDACVEADNRYECNGPLQPDTTYFISGFACTKAGCTDTLLLEARTAASGNGDPAMKNAIIGSTVCILIVIIIAVIVIVVVYKRFTQATLQISNERRSVQYRPAPVASKPIVLYDLDKVVARMHSNSKRLFLHEFSNIVEKLPPSECYENIVLAKNRYVDIKPYAHSIVLLQVQNEDPSTRYINANFIPGYNREQEYIATQGPLPHTVHDFWRMVWEKDVDFIVMLTQTWEGEVEKCEQYWPKRRDERYQAGCIEVAATSVSSLKNYTITDMSLVHQGVEGVVKKVRHFHYLTWKDHSAEIPESCAQFVADVRSHIPARNTAPILVHCSAGVGRTGTFIAIDYLTQHLNERSLDETVDILAFVGRMRNYRTMMVQTEAQYVLIHDCACLILQKRLALEKEDENEADSSGIQDSEMESNNDEVLYENLKDSKNINKSYQEYENV